MAFYPAQRVGNRDRVRVVEFDMYTYGVVHRVGGLRFTRRIEFGVRVRRGVSNREQRW